MERIQLPFISAFLLSRFSFEIYKIKKNIDLFLSGRRKYHLPLKKSRSKVCTFQPIIIDPDRPPNRSLCICLSVRLILSNPASDEVPVLRIARAGSFIPAMTPTPRFP